MRWRYRLNACDTRLMRETWQHRGVSVQELEQHGYTKITFRGIYSYHACALLHGSLTFLTLLCPHCTDVH